VSELVSHQPIEGPAAWTGADLVRRSDWIHQLTPGEVADLERVVASLRAIGRPRAQLTRAEIAFEALAPAVASWRQTLAHGRGFVLVRGVPVERMAADDVMTAYWALGLQLGSPVPQNFQGDLLTDIRDTGADPTDPSTRLYKTRAEQDFHTDGADIIGLLCLRGGKRGGESRIVSSLTVVNEVLRRQPALVPVLFRDFYWHYFEPHMEAPVHFTRPICRDQGGRLNTFFIPWYIRRAQELPDVPPLTDEQQAALAALEATANDPTLYLDMEFRPGDIQLLKNSVILHKRTAYEDWDEPARKRHLLRLWLAAPDFDDGDDQLRGGVALTSSHIS
jgi:hypothetical protein